MTKAAQDVASAHARDLHGVLPSGARSRLFPSRPLLWRCGRSTTRPWQNTFIPW